MVRRLFLFGIFLISFLWTGCDLIQKAEEELSAPDVGSAGTLDDFTGTVPTTSNESKTLFLSAKNALDDAMDQSVATSLNLRSSLIQAKSLKPKTTYTTPINETIEIGGGTVTLTGSEEESYPDTEQQLNPNSSFSVPITIKEDITALVDTVTVPLAGTPTYTMNGKYIYKLTMTMTVSGTTDAEGDPIESSLKLSFSVTLQMGIAMSVSASTGQGGKFIVSFPFEYSKSNLSLSSFDEESVSTSMESDLMEKLQSTTAQLKVYDNSDTLKHTINLTLEEVGAASY